MNKFGALGRLAHFTRRYLSGALTRFAVWDARVGRRVVGPSR